MPFDSDTLPVVAHPMQWLKAPKRSDADLLRIARDYIRKPELWLQNNFSRREEGGAFRQCAISAIHQAVTGVPIEPDNFLGVRANRDVERLCEYVACEYTGRNAVEPRSVQGMVCSMNNQFDHEHLMDVLARAIARAEACA